MLQGLFCFDGVPFFLDGFHVPAFAQDHGIPLVERLLLKILVLNWDGFLFIAFALFGLALSDCIFDPVEGAIGDIDRGLVLFADLFIDDVSVLLQRKPLVVIHCYLHLFLRRKEFLSIEELAEIGMLEDLLDREALLGVKLQHFADQIHAFLIGVRD